MHTYAVWRFGQYNCEFLDWYSPDGDRWFYGPLKHVGNAGTRVSPGIFYGHEIELIGGPKGGQIVDQIPPERSLLAEDEFAEELDKLYGKQAVEVWWDPDTDRAEVLESQTPRDWWSEVMGMEMPIKHVM